jgi:hypothetical protein
VFLVSGSGHFNDPGIRRTFPTYGSFNLLIHYLNQHLDLNGRGEWFPSQKNKITKQDGWQFKMAGFLTNSTN